MDRGLFGTFDYDRDYLQPPEPREERAQLIGFSELVNGSM
uniref:Uncharacterized protein n=1 Tax=Siphoviridae sp. ctePP3 TaxID=2825591 RepID=A0A8S5QCB3_9CAUD|nr:MAG TPA: hypothetical protein [Siphoviridae sp. ctePP3]